MFNLQVAKCRKASKKRGFVFLPSPNPTHPFYKNFYIFFLSIQAKIFIAFTVSFNADSCGIEKEKNFSLFYNIDLYPRKGQL